MMQDTKLSLYNWLTFIIPNFNWWVRGRVRLLRWCGVEIGQDVEIGARVIFRGNGKIKIGDRVKIYDEVYCLCKNGVISIGDDCTLATQVYLECSGEISVGSRTGIWQRTLVTANGNSKVIIGCDVKVAHNCSLKTTAHQVNPVGVCIGEDAIFEDIVVKNGVWICAGCIVLPGITIEEQTLVAAGAVVTRNFPSHSLLAGVPAIVKKIYR